MTAEDSREDPHCLCGQKDVLRSPAITPPLRSVPSCPRPRRTVASASPCRTGTSTPQTDVTAVVVPESMITSPRMVRRKIKQLVAFMLHRWKGMGATKEWSILEISGRVHPAVCA